MEGLSFEEPAALRGVAEKIARVELLPGPRPAEDFGAVAPEVRRPNVGQSVRIGVLATNGAETWEQAAIILKVHPDGAADVALLCPWHVSPAPTAVKSLSGQIIGHVDVPPSPPPTGKVVMMTLSEKLPDANGNPKLYGWRYAD